MQSFERSVCRKAGGFEQYSNLHTDVATSTNCYPCEILGSCCPNHGKMKADPPAFDSLTELLGPGMAILGHHKNGSD